MSAHAVISELVACGAAPRLTQDGHGIVVRGTLPQALRERVKANKPELLRLLAKAANDPAHHPPELAQGNAPTPDPARWCWPHSTAMNPAEISTFMARQRLFLSRGASADMAEALADRMVQRDREGDDRGLCLECQHLRGSGPYRCAVPRRADLRQPDLPRVLAFTMQRCPAANPIPLTKGQP